MSCVVYQTDKKTGAKYAYESVSYWDKDKQQPRSKRTYIGKVDPETGEIIRKAEHREHSDSRGNGVSRDELKRLYSEIKDKDTTIAGLQKRLKEADSRIERLEKSIVGIRTIAESADV